MNPAWVTIVAVTLAVGVYSGCCLWRRRAVGWEELMVYAINVVGAVTGVYMFVDSFALTELKPQNAIFSAITGICMVIIFGQKSLGAIAGLFRKEIEPK
jgi:hypothetical protein